MPEEVLPVVPNHTILSALGRGGMAKVYLARQENLRRLVAVKVIADRYDDSADFRRRFEREARTSAGLSHPNVVPVYEYGYTEAGSPYISMAFLDGGTLRERLKRRGPSPVEEALTITRQIASALQAAHGRNIIHRDLKPDNVMFQGENAVLTDFGIAKVLDGTTGLTGSGANLGTVRYFSPEQAKGEPVDQRSDIYTLGVVLYEMLTGRLPIESDTYPGFIHRIVSQPPEPLPPSLKGLQVFMDALLAKDPADRIGSCSDVIIIIDAMTRNWTRYGSADRLTDGVQISLSGRRASFVSQDEAPIARNAIGGEPNSSPNSIVEAPTQAMTTGNVSLGVSLGDRTFELPQHQTLPPMPVSDVSRFSVPIVDQGGGRGMLGAPARVAGIALTVIAAVIGVAALLLWPHDRINSSAGSAVVGTVKPRAASSSSAGPPVAAVQVGASRAQTAEAAIVSTADASALHRIEGRWGFAGSADCATFTIEGNTLVQQWPGLQDAQETVVSSSPSAVETRVVLPRAQRGQLFRYSRTTDGLEVLDVRAGRTDVLSKCI